MLLSPVPPPTRLNAANVESLRLKSAISDTSVASKKGARKPNSPLSRSRAAPASLNWSTKPRVRLKCSESACLRDAGWRNAASSSFLRASSEDVCALDDERRRGVGRRVRHLEIVQRELTGHEKDDEDDGAGVREAPRVTPFGWRPRDRRLGRALRRRS